MSGGSARIADGFLLKAIAIVILGGTAISGGVGGVLTNRGRRAPDRGAGYRHERRRRQCVRPAMVYGAILILAVALTIDRGKMPIIK